MRDLLSAHQKNKIMRIAIIGSGNVGVALAADLSLKGNKVDLIKTSVVKESTFFKIQQNDNNVQLKENGQYHRTKIESLSHDLSKVQNAEVIFITIQSTYHEELIGRIAPYLNKRQIVVCVCSYLSSFYFVKYCKHLPAIAETTGPYLEGRIEENDIDGEIVFRVGCRLTRSPLSLSYTDKRKECMEKLHTLYKGFCDDYSLVESGLLNPNMVLHTVGSIMSIPRIEYSHGNFCMYREAYARGNNATLNIMLALDKEKQEVLKRLGSKPTDIFVAGGFLGNPIESFYEYSCSSDRAISPTSVHSRYITEDVSQGLVLLESIGEKIGEKTPIATSLIDISECALGEPFRKNGRTIKRLGCESYIEQLCN